jgi:hypothetical protein
MALRKVEHLDNSIASEIRRVCHRWSPIVVTDAGVLVNEIRVFSDGITNSLEVVAPDRIDQLAALHQPFPVRSTVTVSHAFLRSRKVNALFIAQLLGLSLQVI